MSLFWHRLLTILRVQINFIWKNNNNINLPQWKYEHYNYKVIVLHHKLELFNCQSTTGSPPKKNPSLNMHAHITLVDYCLLLASVRNYWNPHVASALVAIANTTYAKTQLPDDKACKRFISRRYPKLHKRKQRFGINETQCISQSSYTMSVVKNRFTFTGIRFFCVISYSWTGTIFC